MLTLTRTRQAPLGLHIGRRTVSLVQLAGSPERFDLRTSGQAVLPANEDVSSDEADRITTGILRKLIVDHRLTGQKVVGCVNATDLFVETIRLPQMSSEELAKVVQWEASERLPYPLGEAELRYLVAGEVRQDNTTKQEIILLACRTETIRRQLQILEGAGLTPIGIDVEPCAWLRSLYRAGGKTGASRTAYLYCGETTSTVMFVEGQRVLFLKSIAIGGRQFDEAVAQSLAVEMRTAHEMRASVFSAPDLDGDNEVHRSIIDALRPSFDTLVSELELCLRYYKVTFRGRPLEDLVLSGSESAPWLADFLGERAGLSGRDVNPLGCLNKMPWSASVQLQPGRWATPLGLAMKRMTP